VIIPRCSKTGMVRIEVYDERLKRSALEQVTLSAVYAYSASLRTEPFTRSTGRAERLGD